ncbi:cuticle protein 18.7-like [Athalia rosae]|uniref:cuticle protein 18.7-like n=1 Tax=Athalia rosae TaxID=37344 RepID=UPI002033D3EE|nr:cuticle protein 18.7-like [Athalia rosae]
MKVIIIISALVSVTLAKPGFIDGFNGHAAVVAPLAYAQVVVPGAPIGPDGRVVDTPEVAVAKAAHAAAHVNEKVALVNEATRNYAAYASPAIVSTYNAPIVAGVHGLAYV